MSDSEFVVILSSAGSQIEANNIAEALIEQKLAACVSILPGITSHYCWNDKKEASFEVQVMIKTERSKFDKVKEIIISKHSFEVPEILMLPVLDGSPDYLNWMKAELGLK